METFKSLSGDYTNQAKIAFLNMIRGGTSTGNWSPAFIDIGTGGDFNPDGTTPVPPGRVPPDPTELEIRKRIFRGNIVYSEVIGEDEVKYVAAIDAHEAISTDINEFALIATNQVMIAHMVLPPDPIFAEKFEKTSVVRWMLEWVIKIDLQL